MKSIEEFMTKTVLGRREWLTYYLNEWNKNVTARMIDVMTDITNKEKDPEMMVEDSSTKQEIPVALRLEFRKALVEEALVIVRAAEALIAKTDDELVAFISPDALKTDAAVVEKYVPGAAEENKPAEEIKVENAPTEELPKATEEKPAEEVKQDGVQDGAQVAETKPEPEAEAKPAE